MNKIFLIGNVTNEVKSGTTQSGVSYARFTIAVNGRGKDAQAEFINITCWRTLSEICSKYIEKGNKVMVSGQAQAKCFQAKDGSYKASIEVTADEVEFLSQKPQNEAKTEEAMPVVKTEEGDLPF